jgi:beta-RFAP synthase
MFIIPQSQLGTAFVRTHRQFVSVETTARLHMGFIDLNGGLGRRFGSIGLSLDKPVTKLQVGFADSYSATGPSADRALACAKEFATALGLPGAVNIEIQEAIPEHAGLGSGTQLGLAVGTAMARLYGLELSIRNVAMLTGRGRRSGIGVGTFEQGGLLVDGGRGEATQVPPILARMAFPKSWRILLVFDPASQGVHGSEEIKAFSDLPEFPAAQAAHIARLILMQALPAVAERNLSAFGEAISALQQIVGEHFAPAQGGDIYISQRVAVAMAWLGEQGVACLGQSSWGPTGFAIVENEEAALQLQAQLQASQPELRIEVCRACNRGSLVSESMDTV